MNSIRSAIMSYSDNCGSFAEAGSHAPQRHYAPLPTRHATDESAYEESADDIAVLPGQVASPDVLADYAKRSMDAGIVSKWRQHLFSIRASTDVDAISETVEYVFEAVARAGESSVDLRGVASNNVNAEHLVAVLRATYSNRHKIPGWEHARREASEALRLVALDPNEVLVGLD